MTTPPSVSSRSAERGPNPISAGAVPLAPAAIRALPTALAARAAV
ncbi:hypothetical protein [Streptomyces sp. NPDC057695]